MPIRLSSSDAERYARLRLRMLLDAPWAFQCRKFPEWILVDDTLGSLRKRRDVTQSTAQ